MTISRPLAWALLVVGCGQAVLGAALVLNLLSLRQLARHTQLEPAIDVIVAARDRMSHGRAQALELALGLGGAAVTAVALRSLSAR